MGKARGGNRKQLWQSRLLELDSLEVRAAQISEETRRAGRTVRFGCVAVVAIAQLTGRTLGDVELLGAALLRQIPEKDLMEAVSSTEGLTASLQGTDQHFEASVFEAISICLYARVLQEGLALAAEDEDEFMAAIRAADVVEVIATDIDDAVAAYRAADAQALRKAGARSVKEQLSLLRSAQHRLN
jgi:hypothetical protein